MTITELSIKRPALVSINNKDLTDVTTLPRIAATAQNTSVGDLYNVQFVAVVFDPGARCRSERRGCK